MRPRGVIRKAVAEYFSPHAAAQGELQPGAEPAEVAPASWRDLAARLEAAGLINTRAPSELALVRQAVENMKRADEIEAVGEQRMRWSRRPLKLYGARKSKPAAKAGGDGAAELAAALGRWAPGPSE